MTGSGVRSERSPGAAVLGAGPVTEFLTADLESHGWTVRPRNGRRPERATLNGLTGVDLVVVVAWGGDVTPYLAVAEGRRRTAAVEALDWTMTLAKRARVPHVVVLTSGLVYGTHHDEESVFTEDAPLLDGSVAGLVGDMLAIEDVVAAHRPGDGPIVTVLRPAALAGPGIDSMISRHFEAPRLLTVRGVERTWQFTHLDDVAAAVRHVADARLDGAFNVTSAGTIGAAETLTASGLRQIDLPERSAFGTAERLFRTRVLNAPPSELGYVVRSWTLDSSRLEATGWQPSRDARECLDEMLSSKRVFRAYAKDAAAAGAVGAVVAILATAAAWRRAKGR